MSLEKNVISELAEIFKATWAIYCFCRVFMVCLDAFSAPIEVLSNSTGRIISRATEYNSHRHWRITAKPGEQIVLTFSDMWLDFHVNCSYDYIEVIHVINILIERG